MFLGFRGKGLFLREWQSAPICTLSPFLLIHSPRSTFQAPMDPHIVLGGFPTQTSSPTSSEMDSSASHEAAFRNYSSDATAFVVTLPLSSHPKDLEASWELQNGGNCVHGLLSFVCPCYPQPQPNRNATNHHTCFLTHVLQAARAWEAALVALLSDPEGKVARLAAEGNLTLSFSTERYGGNAVILNV